MQRLQSPRWDSGDCHIQEASPTGFKLARSPYEHSLIIPLAFDRFVRDSGPLTRFQRWVCRGRQRAQIGMDQQSRLWVGGPSLIVVTPKSSFWCSVADLCVDYADCFGTADLLLKLALGKGEVCSFEGSSIQRLKSSELDLLDSARVKLVRQPGDCVCSY